MVERFNIFDDNEDNFFYGGSLWSEVRRIYELVKDVRLTTEDEDDSEELLEAEIMLLRLGTKIRGNN